LGTCAGAAGISTYLAGVANITDPSGTTLCATGATAPCAYSYEGNTAAGMASDEYEILFYLEEDSGSLPAGLRTATEAGIQ
jgi:hypothetical protein